MGSQIEISRPVRYTAGVHYFGVVHRGGALLRSGSRMAQALRLNRRRTSKHLKRPQGICKPAYRLAKLKNYRAVAMTLGDVQVDSLACPPASPPFVGCAFDRKP